MANMFLQSLLWLVIACFVYSNQHVALWLNIEPLQIYKWLAFLVTAADQEKHKRGEEERTEEDIYVMH